MGRNAEPARRFGALGGRDLLGFGRPAGSAILPAVEPACKAGEAPVDIRYGQGERVHPLAQYTDLGRERAPQQERDTQRDGDVEAGQGDQLGQSRSNQVNLKAAQVAPPTST